MRTNLTSMTDAVGTVTYTDDALNRVTATTDRRGNTQFFTYDATKQIVQVKDRNGNATQYVYDGNGNIVKTIDALGTESVLGYNKNNQLVSTDLHRVDTLNGVDSHEITLYEYGGRNLVARKVNALGDSTIYVYDGNGNMVSKTDADGYVTQYSYTALRRHFMQERYSSSFLLERLEGSHGMGLSERNESRAFGVSFVENKKAVLTYG